MGMTNQEANATIILVHGMWSDGSIWNKVTSELQRRGYRVIAAQIPLTSLADDVDTLRRILRQQSGPVILAGHSYGGAVITAAAAGDAKVKALVYIAAVVPDEGETHWQVFSRTPPPPRFAALQPDADGFVWLTVDDFRFFMPDASQEATALMSSVQKPVSIRCISEPIAKAAWKEKPSWFLIAENDQMLSPETQRFTARRMKSTVVSLPVDHWLLVSSPGAVADVVEQAGRSTL
jgi:pimeloyl-ACP methyl ester carboxylesterase